MKPEPEKRIEEIVKAMMVLDGRDLDKMAPSYFEKAIVQYLEEVSKDGRLNKTS